MIIKLFVFVFLTTLATIEAKPKFAKCEFEEGVIFFRELKNKGITEIYGEIHGLNDGLHGIHVHQEGGLGNECKDAGGHFDPYQVRIICSLCSLFTAWHCLKITQNVAVEFFNFGISHQFLSY